MMLITNFTSTTISYGVITSGVSTLPSLTRLNAASVLAKTAGTVNA